MCENQLVLGENRPFVCENQPVWDENRPFGARINRNGVRIDRWVRKSTGMGRESTVCVRESTGMG
ncbi:hypothetical protein [Lentibacillus juripiscarius]|uniref:Uncharacterized protein n=1 Tax=Lentibacillus juripiscarius TaxID=257446 RepID=A0ABW5V655_9BACI